MLACGLWIAIILSDLTAICQTEKVLTRCRKSESNFYGRIFIFAPMDHQAVLLSSFQQEFIEAGCDEAGRGCLAGPVFAAAVIFPPDYHNAVLNDSKKLSEKKRMALLPIIEQEALAYAVASVSAAEIDKINIHKASYLAMHKAIDMLKMKPEYLIIDGNKFIPYPDLPHTCIVKGDGKYLSIAAASILAKTYRDQYMDDLSIEFPEYDWLQNKGYPTVKHREAVIRLGLTPHHRKTFRVSDPQLALF